MTAHSAYIPTLEGDEAAEFIRKADDTKKGSVDWSKQMEDCKKILEKSEIPIYLAANNHVWRKHYLNGGKVCQVCGKAKEEPNRAKDVEP